MKYHEILVETNFSYSHLELKKEELKQNISSIGGVESVALSLVHKNNPNSFKIVIWPISSLYDKDEMLKQVRLVITKTFDPNFIISSDWIQEEAS